MTLTLRLLAILGAAGFLSSHALAITPSWSYENSKVTSGEFQIRNVCMMPTEAKLSKVTMKGGQSMSNESDTWTAALGNMVEAHLKTAEVQIQHLLPSRGKMKVFTVSKLRLSRNRTLVFGEHSFALMMIGLKKPLTEGDRVPLTLTLEFSGKRVRTVEVEAEVRALELSYKHYGGQEVHDNQ